MASGSVVLPLNDQEFDDVMKQPPDSVGDGGFQNLMVAIQENTNKESREMVLPLHFIERIHRYAFKYKQGGWEDRLKRIFSRHLGPKLDLNLS